MDNKYIDKVLDHLVKGTKLDYGKQRIYFLFLSSYFIPFVLFQPSLLLSPRPSSPYFRLFYSLSNYCRNQFGLTEEEIDYVWKEYIKIIKEKIKYGE